MTCDICKENEEWNIELQIIDKGGISTTRKILESWDICLSCQEFLQDEIDNGKLKEYLEERIKEETKEASTGLLPLETEKQ